MDERRNEMILCIPRKNKNLNFQALEKRFLSSTIVLKD